MARPKKQDIELTELERDLLEASNEMLAHARGEIDLPTYTYEVPEFGAVYVQSLRSSLHLTQVQFAQCLGASVDTIRHWERGRRKPEGTARRLLQVLEANPRAVLDTLTTITNPQ